MAERHEQTDLEGAAPGAWARREPGDDFFCLRYRIWYPSHDCAIRTRFRTSPGCARCDQGLFNARRHAEALRGFRFHVIRPDASERAGGA
jgi:hypothetical protein